MSTDGSKPIVDGEMDRREAITTIAVGALAAYGVHVKRVVITHVSLPTDFVASREAQGLAAFQRAEEQEQHTLELLRQTLGSSADLQSAVSPTCSRQASANPQLLLQMSRTLRELVRRI